MRKVVPTPFPEERRVADAITLGAAIRSKRTHANMRLEDAAMICGVSKQTYADLETGKPTVALGTAINVAHMMGVSLLLSPTEQLDTIVRLLKDNPSLLPRP